MFPMWPMHLKLSSGCFSLCIIALNCRTYANGTQLVQKSKSQEAQSTGSERRRSNEKHRETTDPANKQSTKTNKNKLCNPLSTFQRTFPQKCSQAFKQTHESKQAHTSKQLVPKALKLDPGVLAAAVGPISVKAHIDKESLQTKQTSKQTPPARKQN